MNVTRHDAILRMLQDDIAGEHAAILQYLQHTWRMGDSGGDIPCEVGEIARDEMRHFRWLAELVVDLGSDPTIERDVVYVNGSPAVDLMLLDVDAEDRAIRQYLEHVRNIDDRRVTRVIERILVDERAHREKFRGYVAELGGDPDAPTPRPAVGPFTGQRQATSAAQQTPAEAPQAHGPIGQASASREQLIYVQPHPPTTGSLPPGHDRLVAALTSDVGHEYTTVLQYLFQSFVHKSNRLGKDLQTDIAQWHMKHWGWMAERIASLGAEVPSVHGDVDRTRDAVHVVRTDLARQRDLSAHYTERVTSVDDEAARTIYARIQAHDEYQAGQLEDFLPPAEAGVFPAAGETAQRTGEAGGHTATEATPSTTPRYTVGSLYGRKQDE